MKTLYLDCGMGAAGDMLTAALIELLPDPGAFVEKLNALSVPGVHFEKERSVKCGITGTHMSVAVHGVEEGEEMYGTDAHHHSHDDDVVHAHHHSHDDSVGHANHHNGEGTGRHSHDDGTEHSHHHSGMREIEYIVSCLAIPENVKKDVMAVYRLIAEAESHVHGTPVSQIHFHEVGAMDAIADVTAVCLLMHEISPDEVVVSPVHVGSGQVQCAHGILPVPAPATEYLLRGVPIYGGSVRGELCTPTGAALLRHFAARFGDMPVMRTLAVGYGMGKKDFERANCVRALLGETSDQTDVVLELSCNVDDMTAEAIGFAMERLFEGGAYEVYTIPIGMKKSRPGTLIRVMCRERDKEKMLELLFRHTTTIGVRETVTHRYVLSRSMETIRTPFGEVRRKVSSGYGIRRAKYEYDDLSRIAKEQGISLDEVKRCLEGDGPVGAVSGQ